MSTQQERCADWQSADFMARWMDSRAVIEVVPTPSNQDESPRQRADRLFWEAARGSGVIKARQAINILLVEQEKLPNAADILNQIGLLWHFIAQMTNLVPEMEKALSYYNRSLHSKEGSTAFKLRVLTNKAIATQFIGSNSHNDKDIILSETISILNNVLSELTNSANELPINMINVDTPRIYYTRGCTFMELGDLDRALDDLTIARNIWANRPNEAAYFGYTLLYIAKVLQIKGNFDDAIALYEQSLSYFHGITDVSRARIMISLARCKLRYFEEVFERDRELSSKLFRDANRLLNQVADDIPIEVSPAIWGEATVERGLIQHRLGNYKDALSLFKKSFPYLMEDDAKRVCGRILPYLGNYAASCAPSRNTNDASLYSFLLWVVLISSDMPINEKISAALVSTLMKKGVSDDALRKATAEIVGHFSSAIKNTLTNVGISNDMLDETAAELLGVITNNESQPPLPQKHPLPKKARITYAKRGNDPKLSGLNIIEFLRAEYGMWLDGTLSRNILNRLDSSAYRALYNFKGTIPDDIRLGFPVLKEVNDRSLADDDARREAVRLASATARRKRAARPQN
jgi:tetratricopeptide (TPR) repeat protein